MHGDSRHIQSRPRRGNGRSAGGAGAERARAAGPLPEPAELARVLEPVVRAAGMDLESVRVSPAGRRRLLKLVVDADGGAALDQIAEVSREASVRLDASGVMGEVPYTLEVSSPGVDRPLTEPRHWRRAQGRGSVKHRPGETGGTEAGPVLDSARAGNGGSQDGH